MTTKKSSTGNNSEESITINQEHDRSHADSQPQLPKKDSSKVAIRPKKWIDPNTFDPYEWPNATDLWHLIHDELKTTQLDLLVWYQGAADQVITFESNKETFSTNNDDEQDVEDEKAKERLATYWQVCARWALLHKYGTLIPAHYERYSLNTSVSDDEQEQVPPWNRLVLTSIAVEQIQAAWKKLCQDALLVSVDDGTGNKNDIIGNNNKNNNNDDNDLIQFLRHRGRSNGLPMQWAMMECKAGAQFRFHAHANLELVLCVRGALHEIRMQGPPEIPLNGTPSSVVGSTTTTTTTTASVPSSLDMKPSNIPSAPPLSALHGRSWSFGTMAAGQWLVNETWSIHKSFTATSGQGCLLVVLWSGAHSDLLSSSSSSSSSPLSSNETDHHINKNKNDDNVVLPVDVYVAQAVNMMDTRLGQCTCTDWEQIHETFLPPSERSKQPPTA